MKKVKKDFWEKIFIYPSFNIRFGTVLILVSFFFFSVTHFILYKLHLVNELSDKISFLNLVVQIATLVLGTFATYYALRQLVETRFNSLEEAGMQELKRRHYSRAFEKWREAFYIRPEPSVFNNLCEALLLIGDYDTFDQYIKISGLRGFLKKEIFQEVSDRIILLYLKSIRNLLVKNQGESEKYLSELITLTSKSDALLGFQWDFIDLQTSNSYQNLTGECKNIADNLISYLQKNISPTRKADFEARNFATQVV